MIDEYQDPYDQPYPSASTGPSSWLPAGATINADGSITLANGSVMPAPPPGYERDPNTGVVSYVSTPGTTPISGLDPNDPNKPNAAWTAQAPTANDPGATSTPTSSGSYAAPAPTSSTGPAPSVGTQSAPSVGPGTSVPGYTPPPAYVPPPAFSYDPFKATDPSKVASDPRYMLARDEGLNAIGHRAAALGTLNTGGTVGDYVGFASNLASKTYDDMWNQDYATYNTNRANAFDAYKTNYGIGKDAYDTNVRSEYTDPFAFNMQGAGLAQQNNQFNASIGQNNNQFNSTMDFDKWLQNYKMNVTDPFDQKYKTLSLM